MKFEDGLFEAFNSAGGSVMQAYGNLFQEQENISYTAGQHTLKAGFEVRKNVDTTYFGIPPNGEYDFGGGTAYATEAIASASGKHNINVGDPLPDTLSGLLSGSPFAYIVAVAPPGVSDGAHIGPAAINRSDYNAYVEDTWKVTPKLTLDYGVRWEYYTPITERAHRTGSFRTLNGALDYVVNPQPGYSTTWNGWGPRVQISWAPLKNFTAHAGGAVMVIPPNIWQDNMLTGSTPFSISPRRQSSSSAPLAYGFTITPSMLPIAYDLSGNDILAKGAKNIPANTPMDVDRYEKDLANVTSSGAVSSLNLSGIDAKFGNGTLYTWTLGLERKIANLTADLGYVGTVAQKLPRISFPNAYPGATPEFAPYTQFNSAGDVTGGFGVMNVMTNDVHSNYNALQASLFGTVGHGGPGIQASYTWGKSIDTTSMVLSGTGSTGATTSGASQDPFNLRAEKGPSAFDATHNFGLSVAQDLHLEMREFLKRCSPQASPTDGNCSPSHPSPPALRSRFTRAYSRRERARTASTVRTRSLCRNFPRRARTGRITSAWERRMRAPILIFRFTSPAVLGRTRDALALSGRNTFPRTCVLRLRLRNDQGHALRKEILRRGTHGRPVPRRVLQSVQHRQHGASLEHPDWIWFRRNFQDGRHFAADSIVTQAYLLIETA